LDRFREDQVDLALFAIANQPHEVGALGGLRARDAFVNS
jgi:hypothetical protein